MPSMPRNSLQFVSPSQRLITREEETQIDDSVSDIRLERIARAEKQRLGAGLVNVIREMPVATLGTRLLASKRFREDMRAAGFGDVVAAPEETPGETIEDALEESQNQSRIRGECLSISIAQLVESEKTRKDQAVIIRNLRASKRRQLLWSIGLSAVAMVLSFVAGYLTSGLAMGKGLWGP